MARPLYVRIGKRWPHELTRAGRVKQTLRSR